MLSNSQLDKVKNNLGDVILVQQCHTMRDCHLRQNTLLPIPKCTVCCHIQESFLDASLLGTQCNILLHLANLAQYIIGTIKHDLGTILEDGLVLVRVRVNEQLNALNPVVHELLNWAWLRRVIT